MSRTVLAVDDSPSVRCMVAMTLREAGYRVIEATDGREGLEKALSEPVDAIITDQNMPNLDGLGFIRAFREHPESKGKPIIFLSTDSADTLKQQAREAGAMGWMVKPFTQPQLLAVIKKVLG
ncbi:response regulator [Rhodobacter sphaeroides]|jgi:Response regulators consisting of a CheY-like receiver domain and a winged-helix DNA-binding domain|uniref:Chemotaxis response regulator, CheY3 n=2 Tax=Cereibacter sphaeroides TaxID=1063 RepID=Q3J658_CERS4|nr:response regulator [Cereibacter sphaeroides]ABN75354.1 response regulator receiver protein [Cereibacter sphaeroides ATCC 17029]EKX57075.1 Chemotaxis regulator - transmits chemoreceptor signals to flagelllar motor components CheY [Rhodobacter sp. AKP1]ABA77726.1 Chemotaxis response regulator, CheY3 [Cereibacter sphaeroides 2.4.1]AMJ46126.1 two-component system response regulator [Cereibacter sphaeroides]ANS32838.1 two-component system response regulator [Cereibacter sphaeroides]